ncbi:MAG: ATP-binding protein [Actinomycetota bacterium]|nr:ATP-binding protein [Actinomycetota bacterium]
MEGPYRDLGEGFARLTGAEGARRSPFRLNSVEDALFELLRNSRDAGARNVYVASSLRARRYRTLVVIDDGHGITETHKHLIFEPGVTTRHLDPVSEREGTPHGAGLSLYHVKNAAILAEVSSGSSPTAVKVAFDTRTLPEKSLQSPPLPDARQTSKTNLPATLAGFAAQKKAPRLYYASPARILARLLKDRIIRKSEDEGRGVGWLREAALRLGLDVSLRTVQRIAKEEVLVAEEVISGALVMHAGKRAAGRKGPGGPILFVGEEDLAEIQATLRRAARSSYLDLARLDVERRPGEVVLRASIYEPEEEYE